jgi:outer membrane immunogenic protein
MMKRILLGSVGLVALSVASAQAADLPARRAYTKAPVMMAAYDWSGFYVGLNGGWGTSHNCWTNTAVNGVPLAPASEGCHDASGGTVGGQIGYRWQMASWVFGVEAQGNWADFKGSNASLALAGVTNRTKIDAFGLFTGQVGYSFNNVLVYVKGGAAVTDNTYDGLATGVGGLLDTATETRWGGTVGAGVEFSFAPNWSVAAEYDHLFMGTSNINFPATAAAFSRTDSIKQDVDLVTVRLNYRFGGPVVAKY